MVVKVKATGVGYYNDTLRKIGDVFEIQDRKELGSWMQVQEDQKRVEKPAKVKPAEPDLV